MMAKRYEKRKKAVVVAGRERRKRAGLTSLE
jgi:hypothetical protein